MVSQNNLFSLPLAGKGFLFADNFIHPTEHKPSNTTCTLTRYFKPAIAHAFDSEILHFFSP